MIFENLKKHQIINPIKVMGGNTSTENTTNEELFTNGSRQFPTPRTYTLGG
ncbi:hypothetical protein [uncultured Dokdonia sp.]|uniref:hypothetical protein n=1 Tax=uncultured Dokdonia sp. TaxID=575653 RepID=UPI00260E8405|nr:hypothetical protein [uncultured Dokdonia sp.]